VELFDNQMIYNISDEMLLKVADCKTSKLRERLDKLKAEGRSEKP
jgi:hypothetical protein